VQTAPLSPDDPAYIGGFELLGRIGQGGMGQVYLGESPGGEPAAVKVIKPSVVDSTARLRFAQEIEILKTVYGTRIAQLLDADTDAQQPWLATEYVEGSDLGKHVMTYSPLPALLVLSLGATRAQTARCRAEHCSHTHPLAYTPPRTRRPLQLSPVTTPTPMKCQELHPYRRTPGRPPNAGSTAGPGESSAASPGSVDAIQIVSPVIDRVVRLQVSDPDSAQPGPLQCPPRSAVGRHHWDENAGGGRVLGPGSLDD